MTTGVFVACLALVERGEKKPVVRVFGRSVDFNIEMRSLAFVTNEIRACLVNTEFVLENNLGCEGFERCFLIIVILSPTAAEAKLLSL